MPKQAILSLLLLIWSPFWCRAEESLPWILPKGTLQLGVPAEISLFYPAELLPEQLPKLPQSGNAQWRWGNISKASNELGHAGSLLRLQVVSSISGELHLPSLNFAIEEQTLSSAPLQLQVSPAIETPHMVFEVAGPQGALYEGEGFHLDFTWTTRLHLPEISALLFDLPILKDPAFKLHPSPPPEGNPANEIGIPIGSQRVVGHWERVMWKGEPAHIITFRLLMSAHHAKDYHFEHQHLYLSVPKAIPIIHSKTKWRGMVYPSFFNNSFFQKEDEQKSLVRLVSPSTQPLQLSIRALPRQGRPENFSGHIGLPKLELVPMERQLSEGQSFEMQLAVQSDALLPPPLPALKEHPSYLHNFSWNNGDVLPLSLGQQQLYRLQLTPLHAELEAIPPLTLSCFDPETHSYVIVRSNSPEVTILPSSNYDNTEQKLAQWFSTRESPIIDEHGVWADHWGSNSTQTWIGSSRWLLLALLAPPLWLLFVLLRAQGRKRRLLQAPPAALQKLYEQLKHWQPNRDPLSTRQLHLDLLASLRALGYPLQSQGETCAQLQVIYAFSRWLSDVERDSAKSEPPHSLHELREAFEGLRRSKHGAKTLGTRILSLSLCSLALLSAQPNLLRADDQPATSTEVEASPTSGRQQLEKDLSDLSLLAHRTTLTEPHRGRELHRQLALRLEGLLQSQTGGLLQAQSQDWARWAYNLGNHWFHADDFGRAILWYQRALNVSPQLPHLNQNLNMAREKRLDALPAHFHRWSWTRNIAPHIEWLWILFVGLNAWFFWTLNQILHLRTKSWTQAWPLALLWLFSSLALGLQRYDQNGASVDAVITTATCTARKGPSPIFAPAFTTPLHAGTELVILEEGPRWSKVLLSNGDSAWLAKRNYEWVTE